jgi:carbamoyl-phosphate synthase large subunit
MQRILILGAGEMQLPIIQKAIESSIYTIVVDMDAKAPGLLIANKTALISTIDYDKILLLAKEEHIDGILTTSDFPVNIVAKVAQELSLPAMSVNVAKICTDKYLQRSLLKEHKIKTPIFKLIEAISELEGVDYFPLVIKPVDSSASRGVKKVANFEELQFQYLKSKEYSKKGKVIVEEFLEGREFSVEAITQKGITNIIAITEKLTNKSDNGYFVEDCHIIPARITKEEYQTISNEVLNAIQAIEIDNSPTHTEVILNKTGAYIVEIACRLGGDYITSDLVPLATGVSMLQNLLNLSLGKEVAVTSKYNKVAAVQFLNQNNYKNCVALVESGNKAIIRSEIKPYHTNEISSSFERMGYVILNTNSIEEMETLLSRLK